jgi:hypothetical protein
MDFRHDAHDWLGGFPYESISPAEVDAAMRALGLTRERAHVQPRGYGVFGTGCDEFVYRRLHGLGIQARDAAQLASASRPGEGDGQATQT